MQRMTITRPATLHRHTAEQQACCKRIKQGRVVHRYAFQAVLGSRVDSASEFQFRTLESCQI